MTGLCVENVTDERKIIDIEVKTKLCWIGAAMRAKGFEVKCGATGTNVDERHSKCTANFPEADAFREYDLGVAFEKQGLHVEHLTTDGDSSSFKGLTDATKKLFGGLFTVKHQLDSIHLHQAQTRAGHRAEFSKGMFPGRTAEERTLLKTTFLNDLRVRSSKILQSLFKRCNGDLDRIMGYLYDTVACVVNCYGGDCTGCPQNEFSLCSGTTGSWWHKSTRWSSYGEIPKLKMTVIDKNLVHLVLEVCLSKGALRQLSLRVTTQGVESKNRGLLASDPKIVTRSRNSTPRFHSAAHRMNHNIAESGRRKLKWFNIEVDTCCRPMKVLDRIAMNRQYTVRYKRSARHQQLAGVLKNIRATDYFTKKKNKTRGGDYNKHVMITMPDLRRKAVARRDRPPVPEWKCLDPNSRHYDHSYFWRSFQDPTSHQDNQEVAITPPPNSNKSNAQRGICP
ncbi:uncharacterized protein LOC135488596 isoform X1 [Lineus longissimus]|uniref:uncharacterized protein LOC135488596 isoform X1 n=1 Tax=Lineus longissimus TaxID=88925 RepID=UPI00315D5948